jgi:hypothetical protein
MLTETRYKDFIEKYPDVKSRIEAFTSLLSPDTKGMTLWSMLPNQEYMIGGIYRRLKEFCRLKKFPVNDGAVWQYLNGTPAENYEGSLTGFVEQKLITYPFQEEVTYKKTQAGIDFGDAIVAKGTWFVNELMRLAEDLPLEKRPMFYSLNRIIGFTAKSPKASLGRAYAVHLVCKYLLEHTVEHSVEDLVEELYLDRNVVGYTLNSLGHARIIDYFSPHRDIQGKTAKGYAKKVVNPEKIAQLNSEYVYREIREKKPSFHEKGILQKVITFIKDNPSYEFEYNSMSKTLEIHPARVLYILSILTRLGYLNGNFTGRTISKASANRFTELLCTTLLYPIETIAESLDLKTAPDLYDRLEFYRIHPDTAVTHRQRQLELYDLERNRRGPEEGKKLRGLVLNLLEVSQKKKLSLIVEELNKGNGSRTPNQQTIRNQLNRLIKDGKAVRVEEGYYQKSPLSQNESRV